jgi:hypothetical protein
MSEKTLGTIIGEVQDGMKPDYEDLRYALLAMSGLRTFDSMALMRLAERERNGKYKPDLFGLQWQWEESHKRGHTAFNMPPKQWVGPSHDPDTEECQRFRKMSKGILKKVMERKIQNPSSSVQ